MKITGAIALVALAAGVFGALPARANDGGESLSAFLDQARQNSPRLQAARQRALGSAARVGAAGAWDDPQIGVEFFATPVTSANPFADGRETDFFVQQMIPLFGKRGLMADAAAASAQMAGESAAAVERDLVADVTRSYAMIFVAQRQGEINAENERLLDRLVESATTRYRTGSLAQGDLLRLQVEQTRLQNERSTLEQELVSAVAMMNGLRGLDASTPIGRVDEPSLIRLPASPDDLVALALDQRPDLRAMRSALEMRRSELAAAERARLPDLMVRGMYKRMVEGTDLWSAMFSVNVPIAPWSGDASAGRVEENAFLVRAAGSSLADMEVMIRAEVRDAWARASSAVENLERYRTSILPKTELALHSLLSAFEANRVDLLSLLDSYRMYQMLRMEYTMLQGEYRSNVAALERAVGGDLPPSL